MNKKTEQEPEEQLTWRALVRENPRIIYAAMVLVLLIVVAFLCTILFGVILFFDTGTEGVN